MARRNIEVFSVSFLDLLSGALGAVILLYVIIPRISVSAEDLEEHKKLSEEVKRLGLDIEKLKTLLPQGQLLDVQAQMQELLGAKEEIETRITDLRRRLKDCEAGEEDNHQAILQLEQQVEAEALKLKACEGEYAKLEGSGKFVLVTMNWETIDDVDLHIVDPEGRTFNFEHKRNEGSSAELTMDNTKGPGLEIWNLIEPPSGRYTVYANLYKKQGTAAPSVIIRIYHRNGVREYPGVLLAESDETAGKKKLVGSFDVPRTGPVIVN